MIKQWKEDFIYHITYKPECEYEYLRNVPSTILFKRNGKLHNIGFPALILFDSYFDNMVMLYYCKGKLFRPIEEGPTEIYYDLRTGIKSARYNNELI